MVRSTIQDNTDTQRRTAALPKAIFVDARSLQDPDYRFRGVGQHSSTVLEALRHFDWSGKTRPELVALTDPSRDPLHPQHRRLFDSVRTSPSFKRDKVTPSAAQIWYLTLSPMTHEAGWASSYLMSADVFKITLFYDLIQLQFPERYLADRSTRVDFMCALAWLKQYDAFSCISQYTADCLMNTLNIPRERVFLSGVPLRAPLLPPSNFMARSYVGRKAVLVSGGGDPRKNPECAIVAHAGSDLLRAKGIGMTIIGSYPEGMRKTLRSLYAAEGGKQSDLSFQAHLTDAELQDLYARSLVTVVPSRAEGFSIPIVESNAAGTPVLASDVGAHPELLPDADDRFDPDDPDALRDKLEALASDQRPWLALRDRQAGLWKSYTPSVVGEKVVTSLQDIARGKPAAQRSRISRKPQIAVLTPLPPAASGVADFTAATLRPLSRLADVHMYTPSRNAEWESGWSSLQSISNILFSPADFDATVSVMGNSFHHKEVLSFLLRHGGACIAHDARQIDFYCHEIGLPKALAIAQKEMKRPVNTIELEDWLNNQGRLPTLFLSEIVDASSPLFVHSPVTAKTIDELYGVKPNLLPFVAYHSVTPELLTEKKRMDVRRRLGLPTNALVIASFGFVSLEKAPLDIVWACGLLRNWGVDIFLVFCGQMGGDVKNYLLPVVRELEIADRIRIFDHMLNPDEYSDYLIASDAAIQLRTYGLGGLSGALADCIGAAIPVVANEHLAQAMQAPSFVRQIPDNISTVLLAEALLDIQASGQTVNRPIDEARAHLADNSAEKYCRLLLQGLGIDA